MMDKKQYFKQRQDMMYYKSLLTEIVWFYRNGDNEYTIAEWKKVMDKKKELIGVRIEYWHNKKNTELNYIKDNPTKECAKIRMEIIKKEVDCSPKLYAHFKQYIIAMLDSYYNLGNSEAFLYLYNFKESEDKTIEKTPYTTFKYKGDLEEFYSKCMEYKVIDSETSLESFKIAFGGVETRDRGLIKRGVPKTTFAVFISFLNDAEMFEDYPKNFHKVGEAITGESDFKNALAKLKTIGTVSYEKKIRELVKSLSVNK